MAFCTKCGFNLTEGTNFCPNCGKNTNISASYNAPPQYVQVVRPKIPGRGFGIAYMVLGIIGLFYSFIFMIMSFSVLVIVVDGEFMPTGMGAFLAVYTAMFSALSILAWTFSVLSSKRGYVNGISKSGLVMGIIGVCAFALSVILFIAASSM